ncbi:unnamed protein product [Rotaria sordida]|uniref:ARF7 effector protein C-terminal domain-containing protein n=2 Tax=Rotaria sordida TaxID=392033 RepID=A0A815STK4_9BILA|nr:unnamed protein product [Rotaria sordida]CAF1497249.1 unnamed protein product [Rotaria sordida]
MKELATALELNASSYRTIARWEKRLHEKGEDVNNDLQSGRLVFEFTDVNCELVRKVANSDPHSIYDDIIAETTLYHGFIYLFVVKKMDDNNKNIFDVLESPSSPTQSINDFKMKSTTTISSNSILSIRRSHLPLMNAGNGFYPTSSSPTPSSTDEYQRKKRTDRALHGLGFINPGPKNLVNVANVPARRPKTRQPTTQEKPSTSKPLYDASGLLISDQTDRCDCNRLKCPGCFIPCTNCQSPKCGIECRNHRTYSYEYRLYGTNKEIIQQ